MKTILSIAAAAPIVLFGLSWGAMSMSPPDYATARGLMCSAAITVVIWYGFWLPMTDEPIWTKSLIGAFVGLIALGGLPWGLDWIGKRETIQSAKAALPTQKDARLVMARQWIRLADEISADLPPLQHSLESPYVPSTGMTPELWKQQTDRSQRAFETLLDSMRLKYRGRIAAARDEMLRDGIPLTRSNPSDVFLTDPALMFPNHFSFMGWANKLNIEGRGVLSSYGVSE